MGSFLCARARGGQWLVRIEDVDLPRAVDGAADSILRDLQTLGLDWDEAVIYQSTRLEAYGAIIETLRSDHHIYPCGCTRREVGGGPYPGTCRDGIAPGKNARSLRLRTAGARIAFHDRLRGPISQDLESEVGDFVVLRADGLYAYHLAVVLDDAEQAISEVVRGSDLLDVTPRQIYLQQCLGLPTPAYAHLPVAVDPLGDKLSKQTGAAPIDTSDPVGLLLDVLTFLDQAPPAALRDAALADLWDWAISHWCVERIPRARQIQWRQSATKSATRE